jgi:mRNA interferase RelE/StbE
LKTWRIEIKPSAEKLYLKLGTKMRKRIKESLRELEQEDNPFLHQSVRPLTGNLKGDYRMRVGDWRVLFTPDKDAKVIHVYAILPRGDAY